MEFSIWYIVYSIQNTKYKIQNTISTIWYNIAMPQMFGKLSVFRLVLAKNVSAQLVGRFVSALSTLVVTLVIARMFGSVGYGDFVKMTTFVSFFYLFADFGFNAIYIQRSSLSPTSKLPEQDSEWSTLLGIRILLSSALIVLAGISLFMLPINMTNGYTPLVRMGILLLLPTIFFQSLITTANGLFQKLLRYEWSSLSVVVGAVFSLVTIGILMATGSTSLLLFSILPLLIGSMAMAFVSLKYSMSALGSVFFVPFSSVYRTVFLSTLPLGLTLVFNVIYFHIDSLVLTFSRPTFEVGVYGLAYKVFELLLVVPTFFMNAVYPMLVHATRNTEQETRREFHRLIKQSAKVLFFVSCLLSLLTWCAAPLLSLIKPDFVYSVSALRILALGLPLFFLSSLCMWVLISLKKQWALVGIYGVLMIVNIVLNIVFVPSFGYMAAAWITVGSEGLVLLASGVEVGKSLEFRKQAGFVA